MFEAFTGITELTKICRFKYGYHLLVSVDERYDWLLLTLVFRIGTVSAVVYPAGGRRRGKIFSRAARRYFAQGTLHLAVLIKHNGLFALSPT